MSKGLVVIEESLVLVGRRVGINRAKDSASASILFLPQIPISDSPTEQPAKEATPTSDPFISKD